VLKVKFQNPIVFSYTPPRLVLQAQPFEVHELCQLDDLFVCYILWVGPFILKNNYVLGKSDLPTREFGGRFPQSLKYIFPLERPLIVIFPFSH